MKNKRLYYVVMPFIMAVTLLISLFAPLVPTRTSSAAEIQATGLSASDATVTDSDGKTINSSDTTYTSRSYSVSYHWTISDTITVKSGDTMTFEIPSNLKVLTDKTISVNNDNGKKVGTATITKNATTGTIEITNPENLGLSERTGKLTFDANGTTQDSQSSGWMLNKAAWHINKGDKTVTWQIVYNPNAKKLNNVTITDTIGPNQTYVKSSLKVEKGTVDSNNQFHSLSKQEFINATTTTSTNSDGNTILNINVGDLTTAISITYQTTPDSDFNGTLTNEATDNNGNSDSANASWGDGSGEANGKSGSVTLKKVSSTNSNQKLEGAVFKIVKYDNDKSGDTVVSNLTTDKNGEISYNELPAGKFAFIETKAPDGYELDTTPHSFEISKENNYSAGTIIVADKPSESKPETTSLTVTKVWDDSNNKDAKRPSEIKVQLYANNEKNGEPVTLSSDNNWKHIFSNLAKTDKDGKTINYTVREVNVPEGYTSDTKTDGNNVTITNTYKPTTPTENTTSLTVNKVWNDNNNAAGLRPSEVQVQLYANGKKSGDPITLNLGNNWSYDFTNLAKKDANGNTITYTVKETTDFANYTSTVDSSQTGKATITNTFVQPTKETTSLTVNKVWNDSNNQDNTRPSSVTVKLLANDKETGKSVELSNNNNWTATFSDLDKKDGNGNDIKYTVEEVKVDGYTTKIGEVKDSQITITNTHTPTTPPAEDTTILTVNKVWNDNNNAAGLRPSEVQVQLYANGEKSGEPITLNLGNNWSYKFTNLPEKDAKGNIITYTVKEVNTDSNYVSTIDNSQKGQTTITNTYIPPTTPTENKTSYTVNKIWNDENNKDGKRPESVQIQLYANGKKIGEPITLSSVNGWAYTFNNLPKTDQNGNAIKYTAKEVNVANGYTSLVDVSESGKATITNTYTPSKSTTPDKPNEPSTPVKPSTPSIPTQPTTPSASNFPTHSSTLTNSSLGNFQPKSEENATQKLLNKLLPQTGSNITNVLTYIGMLVIAMVIILSGVAIAKRNK